MSTVLITGTSTGIGMATALELARAGHRVLATMRNPDRANELEQAAIAEALPITIHQLDVDSDSSVKEAFADFSTRSIEIDVLVNNAGVERLGTVEETPLESFRTCMETNYFGAIRCIQAVLPQMCERGSGLIVNVTSVAGRIASGSMSPYVASKWALEGFSECLAQEVTAKGVRVAVVQPGIIDTRMARSILEVDQPSKYPHGRRMSALFASALANGQSPLVVAQKVREIIDGDAGALRHPAGVDAAPFLGWRASMTDEAWVQYGAQNDEDWKSQVSREFGLTVNLR